MECICPNCGRKMQSSKLAFDFTKFIRETVIKSIKDPQTISGCDMVFNNLGDQPFLESEEHLASCPCAEEQPRGKSDRYVKYQFPYQAIIDAADKSIKSSKDSQNSNQEDIVKFRKWLDENRTAVEKSMEEESVLWLKKTDDGDIRFNAVYTRQGKTIAKNRVCPNCFGEMSYWAGRYPEIVLTVLGGPRVSKSTTLTSCAYAFMKGDNAIQWEGYKGDTNWKNFKENYLDFYMAGKDIKPTEVNEDTIPRLTFRIKFKNLNSKSICLTFVDIPGEYNNSEGVNEAIYRKYKNFYDNIDFVWYCTDPAEVRELDGTAEKTPELLHLGYEKDKGAMDTESLIINMNELSGFFKQSGRHVPVAYILGKTDSEIISEADNRQYQLFQESVDPSLETLDVRDFFRQSQKVRRYISAYNARLIDAFDSNFPDRCYIAVSAYGFDPKAEQGDTTLKAYNCKLPFYWMMALRSCIDIKTVIMKNGWMRKTSEEIQCRLSEVPEKNKKSEENKKRILDNLYMHSSSFTI